jgi:hypothetical protein
MNRKFLITLALACIVVGAAPSSGQVSQMAFIAHLQLR